VIEEIIATERAFSKGIQSRLSLSAAEILSQGVFQ
jgi:hypothetical protein